MYDKNVSCLLRCLQILEIMILLWKRWLQIGKMHLWFACFYSIGPCVLMLPGVTGMPWMDSHDSSPSSDAPSSGASGDMAISLVENLGVQPWTVWPLNGWCLQWNMNLALNDSATSLQTSSIFGSALNQVCSIDSMSTWTILRHCSDTYLRNCLNPPTEMNPALMDWISGSWGLGCRKCWAEGPWSGKTNSDLQGSPNISRVPETLKSCSHCWFLLIKLMDGHKLLWKELERWDETQPL